MQTRTPWPANQRIESCADASIGATLFTDIADYHPALIAAMLRLENDPKFKEKLPRGSCGTKIFSIDQWGLAEAEFLHQRAIAMFKQMLQSETAHVDLSWGNVYRENDYCMPHSHIRAQASVVYMLDPGDVTSDDPLAARFYFADPRLAFCNQHESGRMTRLLIPQMPAGAMLIFPGVTVHGVNPYFGSKPRMTLSWNINQRALPGHARTDFEGPLNNAQKKI